MAAVVAGCAAEPKFVDDGAAGGFVGGESGELQPPDADEWHPAEPDDDGMFRERVA